jgi:hypothetical protein
LKMMYLGLEIVNSLITNFTDGRMGTF